MISLALQLLSGEVYQFIASVDVVGKIAVRFYRECVRERLFDQIDHIIAHTEHQKGMAHRYGVVADGANHLHRTFIAGFHSIRTVFHYLWFGNRHHIGEMASGVKTKYEIVVDNGKLCVIQESPADQVREGKVAILSLSVQSETLNECPIGCGQVFEFNHKRIDTLVFDANL